MRPFALFTQHSHGSAPLAEATLLNHWRYSLRHNYDYIIYRNPWPEARRWVMEGGELGVLGNHEAVLQIGSDVVFTNFSKAVHEFCDPNYGLVITDEHWNHPTGFRNEINCGCAIYQNNEKFRWYIRQLQTHLKEYLEHPLYHQDLMIDLLGLRGHHPHVTDPFAKQVIKIIPARLMNSAVHPFAGEGGRWHPGDLVAHCFAIPEGQPKMDAVKKCLALVQE